MSSAAPAIRSPTTRSVSASRSKTSTRAVTETYGREVVGCGPAGAGAAAKAARNLIALGAMALAADALALAAGAGVDRARLARIVRATDPGGHCRRLLEGTLGSGGAAPDVAVTGLKDLAVAAAIAAELGVEVPTAAAAARCWDRVVDLAGSAEGSG